ncbi:MAG TPA: methylamine utilization protein MauJ [Burkholderiales bacterium]|nr:methylamine utilization protein MauJ [Burkholderiales bacterium]
MEPPYIRTGSTEEAKVYSSQPGPWTVANLQQSIGWTQKPITVDYAGRTFLLLPEDDSLPAIATRGNHDECRRAILEFASALAWSSGGSVAVESWGGGSHIFRSGKRSTGGQISTTHFHVDYLPSPLDKDHKLALALFHEGSTLTHVHVAYSFLSFYKIINLASGQHGAAQMAWINAHISLMKHHRMKERLAELQKAGEDIGKYIYQSCRCAIAHAGDPRNPVIDPHNLEDERRLRADLPLVITLGEIAIEEMGIKTSQTVYHEHRYELSGFEQYFTPEFIGTLKAGGTPANGEVQLPERLSLRIWGHPRYPPLEDMKLTSVEGGDGLIAIGCRSNEKGYHAYVVLDFPNYRLKVEVGGENLSDDGSAEFIEATKEIERFFWDWNGNGCLEVWAEDECLGRCDAFIPVNVMLDPKGYEARVAELDAEITKRPRRATVTPA